MTGVLKRLNHRHFLMIRLAFQGWRQRRIAEKVGVPRETVSRVLQSPLARTELARMRAAAEDLLTDIPFQAWLTNTLKGAATTTKARQRARQLRAERRKALISSPNPG